MSRVLHLYVIHSPKLTTRYQRIQQTVQVIRNAAHVCSCELRLNMVTKPEVEHLQDQLQALDARVKYDKVGNETFDNFMSVLSIQELSNYEKHREVWRSVLNHANDDLFMVIEDDTFCLPDAPAGLTELLRMDHSKYDFLSLSISNDNHPSMEFLDMRGMVTVLPSKDAYMLSKSCAQKLLDQTEKITFSMRIQMSYILHTEASMRVKYPSKRMLLEGSKVGMYPSTLHSNNILIYNQEFMELFQMMQKEHIDPKVVRNIYRNVTHIQSADIAHLYGVLLYKAGELKEAQDALLDAVELAQKQQGMLGCTSDILNNTINIHQFTQWDLESIMQQSSKYTCKA